MFDKWKKLKRVEGTFGKWEDANKVLPKKNGSYIVILETKSPVNYCQSWAGQGDPELNSFCDEWGYPWSGRGTLTVAYWMPTPKFNKRWQKNHDKPGEWVDV